jgi:hypothetical protein
MPLRFKKWPYEKPITVTEETEHLKESYVIDRWCLFKPGDSGPVVEDFKFDVDIYKILKSFLLNPKNRKSVVVLACD